MRLSAIRGTFSCKVHRLCVWLILRSIVARTGQQQRWADAASWLEAALELPRALSAKHSETATRMLAQARGRAGGEGRESGSLDSVVKSFPHFNCKKNLKNTHVLNEQIRMQEY